MEKKNVLISAAVAGLFAVSAQAAGSKVKTQTTSATTEEACKALKDTWTDGKCMHSCGGKKGCNGKDVAGKNACGANGCNGKDESATTAPSTSTTPAPAPETSAVKK